MLCQVNGSMKSILKIKLMKDLEKLVESKSPKTVTSTIIDEMHLLDYLPFGRVATNVLKQVCKQKGNDRSLSIKDCERDNHTCSAERSGRVKNSRTFWEERL